MITALLTMMFKMWRCKIRNVIFNSFMARVSRIFMSQPNSLRLVVKDLILLFFSLEIRQHWIEIRNHNDSVVFLLSSTNFSMIEKSDWIEFYLILRLERVRTRNVEKVSEIEMQVRTQSLENNKSLNENSTRKWSCQGR